MFSFFVGLGFALLGIALMGAGASLLESNRFAGTLDIVLGLIGILGGCVVFIMLRIELRRS
jgi:hypothetical protein